MELGVIETFDLAESTRDYANCCNESIVPNRHNLGVYLCLCRSFSFFSDVHLVTLIPAAR